MRQILCRDGSGKTIFEQLLPGGYNQTVFWLCSSHCTHTLWLLFKVITLLGQYFHTSVRKPAFMKTLFINPQSCKYFQKSMVLKSISSLLASKKFMWQSTPSQMFTVRDKYLKTTFISTRSQWLLRMWMISTSVVQDFFFVLYFHIAAFQFTEDILFQVNQFRNQQKVVSLNERLSKIIYLYWCHFHLKTVS